MRSFVVLSSRSEEMERVESVVVVLLDQFMKFHLQFQTKILQPRSLLSLESPP